MSVEIRLRIDPKNAIRARKSTVGHVRVVIGDSDLAELSDDVLAQLADVVAGEETLEGPGVVDASFASVLEGLRARIERVHAAEIADKAAQAAATEAAARVEREQEERRRQEERGRVLHAQAITAWIEEHCDDDMIERRRDGFLKEEEIMDEVMEQLFDITAEVHTPIKPYQACDCAKGCTGSVRSFVLPVDHLDSSQAATLRQIREEAPKEAEVIPQMRKSSCPACDCVPLARMTALVRMRWNGWMLQKEYALG